MRSVDALGGIAVEALGGIEVDALGGIEVDALGGIEVDALSGIAGNGGGKVEELAVEIGVGCGLQVPQASSSESSTAMVDAAAGADEAAWDTALGGVIGC